MTDERRPQIETTHSPDEDLRRLLKSAAPVPPPLGEAQSLQLEALLRARIQKEKQRDLPVLEAHMVLQPDSRGSSSGQAAGWAPWKWALISMSTAVAAAGFGFALRGSLTVAPAGVPSGMAHTTQAPALVNAPLPVTPMALQTPAVISSSQVVRLEEGPHPMVAEPTAQHPARLGAQVGPTQPALRPVAVGTQRVRKATARVLAAPTRGTDEGHNLEAREGAREIAPPFQPNVDAKSASQTVVTFPEREKTVAPSTFVNGQ